MPIIGHSDEALEIATYNARLDAERKTKKEYADRVGRSANEVWQLWIRNELLHEHKPPAFAPDELIDEVRQDLEREKPGV
jgi:hypothetical protein